MNLQLLQQKLPEIRSWIEHTLAVHGAGTRPVASCGFPRLSCYFSAEVLRTSRVVQVPRVPVPPLATMGLPQFAEFEQGNYAGITYLNTYFVQTAAAPDESLHFHELVHVIQWRHLGLERFLMAYAIGYLTGGGYRNNPLEVMAYDLQARFDGNAPASNVEPFVRNELDRLIPAIFARAFTGEL